jgi:tRNA 5-methylaminomethyl-2-thiouridine biosynthesis bifunctional protein
VPHDQAGAIWLAGATFERDRRDMATSDADQQHNLARLHELLPTTAQAIARGTPATDIHAWAGVRCASHDRLPVVGPIDDASRPGLWLCTAMGSRGLTFAPLAAELLAARLHQEPLPLPTRLAAALDPARLFARQRRQERQGVGHTGDAD